MREACWTYMMLTDREHCPLWQSPCGHIAGDRGEHSRMSEEGYEQDLRDCILDAFTTVAPTGVMAMWFGWVDSYKHLMPQWHARLLVPVSIIISAGVLSKQSNQ